MIEEYLQRLDELLSASPAVSDVEIIRRSIRDTELEKILHYHYRVMLANGGLVEMTERVLEVRGTLAVTKYRHHWQDSNGRLVKRWDNAPHHSAIETFPHHLHEGDENHVVNHPAITGLEALQRILAEVEAQGSNGEGEDPGVTCRGHAAWTLWSLGYPDQALKRSHEALTLAQELASPLNLVWALYTTASLYLFRREWQAAQERAEAAVTLSAEQGVSHWVAWGTI